MKEIHDIKILYLKYIFVNGFKLNLKPMNGVFLRIFL